MISSAPIKARSPATEVSRNPSSLSHSLCPSKAPNELSHGATWPFVSLAGAMWLFEVDRRRAGSDDPRCASSVSHPALEGNPIARSSRPRDVEQPPHRDHVRVPRVVDWLPAARTGVAELIAHCRK